MIKKTAQGLFVGMEIEPAEVVEPVKEETQPKEEKAKRGRKKKEQ